MARPHERAVSRLPAGARAAVSIACLIGAALAIGAAGFTPEEAVEVEPRVRVQLVGGAPRIRIQSDHQIVVGSAVSDVPRSLDLSEWLVVRPADGSKILLGPRTVAANQITLRPMQKNGTIRLSERRADGWSLPNEYPGEITISIGEDGSLEAINLVGVERYVACVVAEETWPGFEQEAVRAQAIAARTYVLDQAMRRRRGRYDVSATEASQVYKGVRGDSAAVRAASATEYSRGIVCTATRDGQARMFTTYYHAVCGGVTQSADIFGEINPRGPLRGGVRCDDCGIAPSDTYRWGPVTLDRDEVRRRLLARYPRFASLRAIRDIVITERAAGGRAKTVRVVGSNGKHEELPAERFRMAIGSRALPSSHCEIRVEGKLVIFEQGRGFGHGLGLCQWGAQGQALRGKTAAEILGFYYPGASLTRAY
jgi:stage II sporulation protein D